MIEKFIIFITAAFAFNSCTKDDYKWPGKKILTYQYLHLSHTRTNVNPEIDSLTKTKNLSNYDMLWLGGDMALNTSENATSMNYVNQVFNLSSSKTYFTLGNHDYTNTELIKSYTGRNKYFATYKNGITIMVLDTQDSLSNIVGAQKQMFDTVTDTILKSSHLVILHHKLIWMLGISQLESLIPSTSNGAYGDCFYCLNNNNFYSQLYPKLLQVTQKGIKVICVGGDLGFNATSFEHTTGEGIKFLGSGIEYGRDTINKVIVFYHEPLNKKLSWKFVKLKDLKSL